MVSRELLNYFKGDELAANVWLSKYAASGETHPDQMHRRMAKEFARIETNYGKTINADTLSKLSDFGRWFEENFWNNNPEQSIYELFKDFKCIIPQGSVMANLGSKAITSLSNCFVIGQPSDSYGGIFQKDEEMVQLMKRRGGVGIDISTLRPKGTDVTNAAKTSTGAVSFMHRFSNSTREVAQDGRRGALMLSISINHPDVMDFIKIKRDLTQITGANISIKLNNDFMKAVENDEDYILRFPCNLDITNKHSAGDYDELIEEEGIGFLKKIKAKEYWNEIIKSAHNVAEPGLIFEDNHIDYSPDGVYEQYKGITTNPCGEIFMQEYDACRLIAANLMNFVDNPFTKDSKFNFDKFYNVNYKAMRLSDDLIDLEIESIDRIIDKIDKDLEDPEVKRKEKLLWSKIRNVAKSSRRTGLGITALGDCLAALGLKYDSDEALEMIDKIFSKKLESELDCTIDLSLLRGTFEGWDWQKEFTVTKGLNAFYQMLQDKFPKQVGRMCDYGRRNVSFNTCAPTGTVSLLANNCTGGIEPLFQPYYFRRKKINPNDKDSRIDFVDQNGDKWQEFPVLHPYFKQWCISILPSKNTYYWGKDIDKLDKNELQGAFLLSPWYESTANDINWLKRVEIQSIIQKYITHSISSTINLPSNVTEEEVSNIYMESWKKGLKGVTVYRDGSRSGVLITEPSKEKTFSYRDAVKRPDTLPCEIHLTTKNGIEYLVAVGLYDQRPYEVFAFKNTWNIPKHSTGNIVKVKKGRYDLNIQGVMRIENITNVDMTAEEEDLTRLVSMSLRHGADITFVAEQLNKTKNIVSFSKALSRVLKKYIPEGLETNSGCPECNGTLVYEEGCKKCKSCGYSAC